MNDRIKPIIRRTTLQAILITAAMSCANNPDQLSESTSEILGRTATDPNVIVPDTTFRSVGYFRNIAPGGPFCTGTLISPQVVLTAAHCFAEYAHGCPNGDTNIAQNEFVLSPGGSNTGISTYAIDDIQVAPSSYYPRAANCPSGSVISCSNYGASTGVRRGSDIALVHLTTPVPGSIAQPTPVYTSRENNGGNFVAELANVRHAMLDAAGSIFASRATIPLPTMVGWGNGSTLGTVRRR